jgi:hypothetical protein
MITRWRCPACGVTVEVLVALVEPPGHRCRRRSDRWLQLIELDPSVLCISPVQPSLIEEVA